MHLGNCGDDVPSARRGASGGQKSDRTLTLCGISGCHFEHFQRYATLVRLSAGVLVIRLPQT